MLVPYPIFLEAHSLIVKRLGTLIGFRYVQEIAAGADFLQPTIADYQAATQLIQHYSDQAITLFDATTTAIAQRLNSLFGRMISTLMSCKRSFGDEVYRSIK